MDTAVKVGDIPILYMSFKDEDVILEFGVNPDTYPSQEARNE